MQRQRQFAILAAAIIVAFAAGPVAAQVSTTLYAARGTWAHEIAACSDPRSDGRVAIRETEIEFFASNCKIGRVGLQSKSGWAGQFRCEESGEFQDVQIELWTPGVDPDPNRLNLRMDGGEWRVLVRCPCDVPVR